MTEIKGLKPEHHEEMNHIPTSDFWKVKGITHDERAAQLREQYRDDPFAQQQLDAYISEINYKTRLDEYIAALHSGDQTLCDSLYSALKRDYPALMPKG